MNIFDLALIVALVIVAFFWGLISMAIYHLSRRHPVYYRKIDSPSLYGSGRDMKNIKSMLLGQKYLYSWIIIGFPKDFPKDKTCKRFQSLDGLNKTVFVIYIILLALVIMGLIEGKV